MQSRQGNVLGALRAVQQFLYAHADKLGAVPTTGVRRRLDDEIEQLNEHAASQEADKLGARGATQRYYAEREILRAHHMAPLARIAALELPIVPELNPFRMPSNKLTADQLYAAAMGMVGAAETHAAVFVGAGLPHDFADQLRAAAEKMLAAINTRRQQWSARCGATRGLGASVSTARKIVRVLDAFVRRELKNDAVLLAGWDTVRRPPSRATRSAQTDATAAAPRIASPDVNLVEDVRLLARAA